MPRKRESSRPQRGFSIWVKDGSWWCKFSLNGHTQYARLGRASSTTESEAESLARSVSGAAREAAEKAARAPKPIPLLDQYLASIAHRSASHRGNYARCIARLREFFGPAVDPRKLDREAVERWKIYLQTAAPRRAKKSKRKLGLEDSTVANHLICLSAMFKWAELRSPVKGVAIPAKTDEQKAAEIKYFTPSEITEILRVARRRAVDYNAMVLLAYTGMRSGELQGIKPEDMDRDRQSVLIVGKGRKPRTLQLSGPMLPAWDALMRQCEGKPNGKPIFPTSTAWATERIHVVCKRGGVRDGTAHNFRHSFATMALFRFDPPWQPPRIAKWMGWKLARMLEIYGHLLQDTAPSGPIFGA